MSYILKDRSDRRSVQAAENVPGADLTAEEIRQERAESGWNPYADEEEPMRPDLQRPPMHTEPQRPPMCPNLQPLPVNPPGQRPQPRPFFLQPEFSDIVEEQKQTERELRMMKSMYPAAARTLLPFVEEECDKMEYEGSPMYDEYPDPTTIYNIQDRIYQQAKDQFDVTEEAPEEILSMQYDRRRRDPRGKNWLDDLARVLLLQEMHHRRCRRRGCRR